MGKLSRAGQTDLIQRELEKIRNRDNAGELRPVAIVNFARDPHTALHSRFEWDDAKAGYEYRLEQARAIIRVFVTVTPNKHAGRVQTVEVPVYTSLTTSRGKEGGYKLTEVVLQDPDDRRQLILDTIARLEGIHELKLLDELRDVLKAVEAVRRRFPLMAGKSSLVTSRRDRSRQASPVKACHV